MSVFQEQSLPISVATVADLATSRARTANGGVLQTSGYTVAGDGGASQYIYRKTGRSLITVNGFHIAGPGTDDYFESTNKLEANAIGWGCDPTGTTDCSTALVAATAALPTGGSIVFPAGTYQFTVSCSLAHCVFRPGAKLKITNGAINTFTGDASTNEIVDVAHGRLANEAITFTGADLPGGLIPSILYYVRDVTTDRFRVAEYIGGPAVDLTDAGTGEMVYSFVPHVTIDSYTASPSQRVFDISAGGVFVITKKHPVTVEHWGAVGDGVTDDSIPGQAAIAATNNVELLAKTYRATWTVDPNNASVSIKGRKSRLIAANNNEFALTLAGNYPGGVCRISEIDFYGTLTTKLKHGLQIATGSAVFVDNCWFQNCGLGLCVNSSIELRFATCWFRDNYVATLLTTRTAVTGWTIDDIAGQTVTLSSDSVAIQHPTEISFFACVYNTNNIAVVCDQPGNIWALAQDLLFDKCVMQYGDIGLLLIGPELGRQTDTCTVMNSNWCEFNDRNTVTRFDGVDYAGGDYITSFGVLEINNGIVETVRATDVADVRLYACSLNETTEFFCDETASITTEMCYGYDLVIPHLTDVTFSIRDSYAALSKSYMPTAISYALANSPRLIRSYTCYEGNALPLYAATSLGTFPDGVLPVNECQGYRTDYLNGASIPYTSEEDVKYSIKFSIKAHCPVKTFTADNTTDVFTSVAHGFADGMEMRVTSAGTLPASMAVDTPYYIMEKTDDTFKLSGAGNMRMRALVPGLDYDDKHTVIGSPMSGDFVLRFKMTTTFGLETSMVFGVCSEDEPFALNNYALPDFGVQYINATTMKLWKNNVETTHTVDWDQGVVTFTRTGSSLTVTVDGDVIASATDASFGTADMHPVFTSASVVTGEVLLYDRPETVYAGTMIARTFESNGVAINITTNGTGIHSISQTPSFNMMVTNIDSGAISGPRIFPITDDWSTWQLHGPAGEGGVGTQIITTAEPEAVRDYLVSAVNVISHANNAEMRDYAQSKCFFAPAVVNAAEGVQLDGDVLIETGASGSNYDDTNTWLGQALNGDFTLEFELPTFSTSPVFGIRPGSTITPGINQYTAQTFGAQYIDSTTVRSWKLGDLTAETVAWKNGKVKITRVGSTVKLFVEDVEVAAVEETGFSTGTVYPTVSFIPNVSASLIVRTQSGSQHHLGSNLTLVDYSVLSRKEVQNTVTFGTAIRLDFDTRDGDNKLITLTNDTTITVVGTRAGAYTLVVKQDGVGDHGITWAGFATNPAQPTQTADSVTVYKFYYDPSVPTFIDVT